MHSQLFAGVMLLVILPMGCLCDISNVTMSFNNGTSLSVFQNGQLQSSFNSTNPPMNCAQPPTYILSQSVSQLQHNTPYSLTVTTDGNVSAQISTLYGRFNPTISPSSCQGGCTMTIQNNCPAEVTSSNYYDIVVLQLNNLPTANYRVWCNDTYKPNTFQWGLFIIILAVTVLISLAAVYSKAWSLGGFGIRINYWIVGVLGVLWVVGGVMGAFVPGPTYIIVLVLSWIVGTIAIVISCNEVLWLFRWEWLNKPLVWKFRLLDCVSLVVALGIMLSWQLTDMNWVSSDIIGICTIVAFIKVFKFTDMQMALVIFAVLVGLEVIAALIIYYVVGTSYNTILLNNFNNPMFIQMPTLGYFLDQKCAWLPVTEVIFPGIFISYLRRFDDSRNTHVYLIISCIAFYIGSMAWMTMTIFNVHAWPFALFSQTLLLLTVVLFATKRNEIRIIWNGKFYDEQFGNLSEMEKFQQGFADRPSVEVRDSVFAALRASNSGASQSLSAKPFDPNSTL